MRVAERSRLSVEEYLAWERLQACKHEYFEGEVYAMAGAPGTTRCACKWVPRYWLSSARTAVS